MKKLFFLLLLSPILPLSAQDSDLKNIIGGQFNYVNVKGADYVFDQVQLYGQRDARSRSLSIRPYIAWKIGKHSLLGIQLGYGRTYNSEPNYNGNSFTLKTFTNTQSGGLFTRHYFRPAARFSVFAEPFVGFSHTKYKQQQNNSDYFGKYKYRQFSAQLTPGIAYHATEHLGLLIRFGQLTYNTGKNIYDDDSGTPFHDLRVNLSLTSLTWGVEYQWGGTTTEPKS